MASFICSIYLICSKMSVFRLSHSGNNFLHYSNHSVSFELSAPRVLSKFRKTKLWMIHQFLEKYVYFWNIICKVEQWNFFERWPILQTLLLHLWWRCGSVYSQRLCWMWGKSLFLSAPTFLGISTFNAAKSVRNAYKKSEIEWGNQ